MGAEAWSVEGAAKGAESPSSLGRGKLRGELPTATLWESYSGAVDRARLLSEVWRGRTRGNGHKMKDEKC